MGPIDAVFRAQRAHSQQQGTVDAPQPQVFVDQEVVDTASQLQRVGAEGRPA